MKYRKSEFFSAMEKDELISYQKKMKSKGFDVNTIGHIDQKTIDAHKEYKKILKKEIVKSAENSEKLNVKYLNYITTATPLFLRPLFRDLR